MSDKKNRGRPSTGMAKTSAERQADYRRRQKESAATAVDSEEVKKLHERISHLELELKAVTNHRDELVKRVNTLESTHKRDVTENRKLKDRIASLER